MLLEFAQQEGHVLGYSYDSIPLLFFLGRISLGECHSQIPSLEEDGSEFLLVRKDTRLKKKLDKRLEYWNRDSETLPEVMGKI